MANGCRARRRQWQPHRPEMAISQPFSKRPDHHQAQWRRLHLARKWLRPMDRSSHLLQELQNGEAFSPGRPCMAPRPLKSTVSPVWHAARAAPQAATSRSMRFLAVANNSRDRS